MSARPLESDAIDFETGEVREIRGAWHNRKFHAMCRELARQVKWAGALMDEEDWKRMLLAAHYGQRMVPNPLHPTKPFIVVNWKRSRELLAARWTNCSPRCRYSATSAA
jgi:hypothetical protein